MTLFGLVTRTVRPASWSSTASALATTGNGNATASRPAPMRQTARNGGRLEGRMAEDFSARYGPWALVLGASNGIGAAFARQVADRGVNVVLVARTAGPLEAAASEIASATGVETRALPVDLTADDMLEQLAAGTDDLDVGLVVYNAGADQVDYFLRRPQADADFLVRLNCVG